MVYPFFKQISPIFSKTIDRAGNISEEKSDSIRRSLYYILPAFGEVSLTETYSLGFLLSPFTRPCVVWNPNLPEAQDIGAKPIGGNRTKPSRSSS